MSGEVLKADKDFSKETDKLIPEAEKLAKVMNPTSLSRPITDAVLQSNVQAAIEKLLVLEKQTRQVKPPCPPHNIPQAYVHRSPPISHPHHAFL
jgi:hypothetical protein